MEIKKNETMTFEELLKLEDDLHEFLCKSNAEKFEVKIMIKEK